MRRIAHHDRCLALLALLGLVLSSVHLHGPEEHGSDAHARPVPEADSAAAHRDHPAECPEISPDDAHHEHSSRATLQPEVCIACRSQEERDDLVANTLAVRTAAAARPARAIEPLAGPVAPLHGRSTTRAPPSQA